MDTVKPGTFITKKPSKRFHQQRVKFKFASNEPHAHFQCRLGRAPWHNCSSPYRFNVKVGKHRLLVRAVDAAGNADRTPARYKFKRLARPRHHHHG